MNLYDVCIVGAGVVGMNIARELAKYKLSVCVLERCDDVSCGCSKANSGIVHGGYSDEPGSLKAELCVAGNRMYAKLEEELNFGYRETGSLVLAFREEDVVKLHKIQEKGIKNGVGGLRIISGDEAREMEPYLSKEVKAALYCRDAGVTSPYEFVIALAENAVANGVELRLGAEVKAIEKNGADFSLTLSDGEKVSSRFVINAAGAYCDRVSAMVGIDDYVITPRRGQYVLLEKEQSHLAKTVIFQVPTELGKGILVTTTYHGNLLVGPNAEEIDDKEDVGTDAATLENIVRTARMSVPDFDMKKAITSFAGNRPISNCKDWVIEESRIKGFVNLIGIDSPGLTSSPAIALKVKEILRSAGLELQGKNDFNPLRKPIIRKKDAAFKGDIAAGAPEEHIICRCEQVTEAEITDALHRGIPVRSLDGVKRRTRAGQGKCQGAFCGPRVRALIAKELGISQEEVTQRGPGSSILPDRAKRSEFSKL